MNRPAAPTDDTDDAVAGRRRRVRFELIFAGIWLGIGLFALPALIFAVGAAILGPYGEGSGLGRFYADFFRDLAEPSVRAWAIALGPLALISLLRLIFVGAGSGPEPPPEERPARPQRAADDHRRVEPRVSTD